MFVKFADEECLKMASTSIASLEAWYCDDPNSSSCPMPIRGLGRGSQVRRLLLCPPSLVEQLTFLESPLEFSDVPSSNSSCQKCVLTMDDNAFAVLKVPVNLLLRGDL